MRITKRQLRRIIKEELAPRAKVDPKIKKQLISWWNGIREEGVKYTWREIQEDVLATLPEERGYGRVQGIGLTRYIESLSLKELDDLFQSVFAGGRWRR
jgi:hypothetical protein